MLNINFHKYIKSTYKKFEGNHHKIIWGFLLPLVTFNILTFNIVSLKTNNFFLDILILSNINKTSQPFLDSFAFFFTNFGGIRFILLLIISAIILFLSTIKKKLLAYFIINILTSIIINYIIKILIHRPRPRLWESDYPLPSDFSFPSGHAMVSMTLALTILIVFWNSRNILLLSILAGIYVISIAWTRLYLGVHFPSDILGGWLLAIALTTLITLLFNLPKKNKNTK